MRSVLRMLDSAHGQRNHTNAATFNLALVEPCR
jgi:hypothetical protein